jgi:peptidoglycan/LPS O-acetylase OafA/YrhL
MPGLDGIRAIACIMVFYSHYNFYIYPQYAGPSKGLEMGSLGVTCFFALSGFLITTLLLREKEYYKKIDFPKFYLRRILRIWPLYFLIILLGALYFSHTHLPSEKSAYFLFYILFLGNVAYPLGKAIWIINPLWSVAVEEQFYSFWPWIVNTKNVLRSLLLFLFGFLLLKFAFRNHQTIFYIIGYTRIDCMAIGGLLALLKFKDSPLLKFFYSRWTQVLVWAVFASSFIRVFHIVSFLDTELYAAFIGIIILNVSSNPDTILSLENPVLKYIGKISYGVYLYHIPIMFFVPLWVPVWRFADWPSLSFFLPVAFLLLTLGVASLSYYFFEQRFLILKEKYSKAPPQSA